jgi:hypothetical protein
MENISHTYKKIKTVYQRINQIVENAFCKC